MRPLGLLLVAVALAVPLWWFVPLAGEHNPIATFSQYLGASALIAMAISQVLATRLPGLETIFGGLDRIYVLHKWLGVGALTAILFHDTIDAEMDGLGRETLIVDVAETFGEISLYGFLILAIITIATFVPYHLWRWSHKAMGTFFALSAFHYAFILKPFSVVGDPLGRYVLAFCIVGVIAYLITLLPARLRRHHVYVVDRVETTGGAVAVSASPAGRGLRHRAGQFAFVAADVPGLGEVHPFTISKAPDAGRSLRFTVKPLGEHTHRLGRDLQPGARLRVAGPYGHFRRGAAGVWIAGGVGVTPFVAWAEDLSPGDPPAHLFYSVRRRAQAPHLEHLEHLAASRANFHLHVTETAAGQRLSADTVVATVAKPAAALRVAFCGPAAMRGDLLRDLQARGMRPSRFAFEVFEIRSGIGLRRMLKWLVARAPGALGRAVRRLEPA